MKLWLATILIKKNIVVTRSKVTLKQVALKFANIVINMENWCYNKQGCFLAYINIKLKETTKKKAQDTKQRARLQ